MDGPSSSVKGLSKHYKSNVFLCVVGGVLTKAASVTGKARSLSVKVSEGGLMPQVADG